MIKFLESRYNWNQMKKEFDERLEKAVPEDLKDYVGLIDAKGYCDICHTKQVLFLDRASKKSFCLDCRPIAGYEFTGIEYNNMWQIAQDVLFYANEVIQELKYPDVNIKLATPTKFKEYLLRNGWTQHPFKNTNVHKFTKIFTDKSTPPKSVSIDVLPPARSDLCDYNRAAEIVIEVLSTFEKRPRYEVFKDIVGIP